jgi:hypothetical protein
MDIFEFTVVSFCNLAVCFWVVKRQGMASVEGYCAAFLGMAALTDNLSLLYDYFFQAMTLPLGAGEFNLRVYPTTVHIVAVIVLMAGLFLANPKPQPIGRDFSTAELNFVAYTGMALLVLGLVLTGFTIALTQAYSASNFFGGLDKFRGDDPGPTGGFYYHGANIAVFGMALMLPGLRKKSRFILVFGAMLLVSFFLKANKGGFETPMLWTAMVLHTYNRRRFWSLAKPRIIVACLILAVAGIAIKGKLKIDKEVTFETIRKDTVGMIGTRWGDDGVFRGWCQFISLRPQYSYLFQGHAEAVVALTNWIPRALSPDHIKTQPTTGLGFMIHSDYHVYPHETPSAGLVGTAYADDEFYSLTAYLLIIGLFLGILRRYAADRQNALHWQISYLCFALFQGLSAEAGITAILYTFILTFTATGLCHLAVAGIFKYKLSSQAAFASVAKLGSQA